MQRNEECTFQLSQNFQAYRVSTITSIFRCLFRVLNGELVTPNIFRANSDVSYFTRPCCFLMSEDILVMKKSLIASLVVSSIALTGFGSVSSSFAQSTPTPTSDPAMTPGSGGSSAPGGSGGSTPPGGTAPDTTVPGAPMPSTTPSSSPDMLKKPVKKNVKKKKKKTVSKSTAPSSKVAKPAAGY